MLAVEEIGIETIGNESRLTAEELISRAEKMIAIARDLQRAAALAAGEPLPAIPRPPGPSADHSVNGVGDLIDEGAAAAIARRLGSFTRTAFADALKLKGSATSKWIATLLRVKAIEQATGDEGEILYRYVRALEDEPAVFQLREWARGRSVPFTAEDAADGTGLPGEEIETGMATLLAEQFVRPVRVEVVDDLEDLDQLVGTGDPLYEYAPPISNGLADELERRRLAQVNRPTDVKRGDPVRIRTNRRIGKAASTPGSRQKIRNNEREYQRMEEAKAKRAEAQKAKAKRNPKAKTAKAALPRERRFPKA